MNILIIGAASKPGRKIIANALRRGHIITALVDKPDRIQMFDDNLRIVKGSCHCGEDLNSVLSDQNVVINVIASERRLALPIPKKAILKSIDTVLPMMCGHQVNRFIVVDTTTPFRRRIDKQQHVKAIKDSSLDWTVIHPAKIIDKPKTCKYKTGENLPLGFFSKITCSDMADFVVSNIDNDSFIGKVIAIRH